MSVTLSITEAGALTSLRSFLLSILPNGTEVVRAQQNRTPEPISPNYVEMTPILKTRLATSIDDYTDYTDSVAKITQPTEAVFQLDFHGPLAADNLQIFTTLWRDAYAVDWFTDNGVGSPLYHSEPRQIPFTNGEQQYEYRWSVDAVMQVNPVVQTALDYADSVTATLVNVDVTYPPT